MKMMMLDQKQQQQQLRMDAIKGRRPWGERKKMRRGRPVNEAEEEEEEEARRLEIVDMSGMGLDSLPSPSPLNIGTIGKLDLSSNNLQVHILYIYILLLYSYIYNSVHFL